MSQGIAQTDGIQVIPRVFVRSGALRFGAQWRNISSRSANGVAALFVRYGRKFGKTQVAAGAAYRLRTGVKGAAKATAWEMNASVGRDFGRLSARLSAEYSPDDFGSGRSLYIEAEPAIRVGEATTVTAGIGRRQRAGGPDYSALNWGVSRTFDGKLTLDARYYQTDRSDLGAAFRPRMVVSARLSL